MNLLKDGTVAKFRAALEKKNIRDYAGWALREAVAAKLIVIR